MFVFFGVFFFFGVFVVSFSVCSSAYDINGVIVGVYTCVLACVFVCIRVFSRCVWVCVYIYYKCVDACIRVCMADENDELEAIVKSGAVCYINVCVRVCVLVYMCVCV